MPTLATTIFANAWHHDGSGWWIVFPLFWILLVGAIVLLLRSRGGWGPPRAAAGHRETALDVLDGRYARAGRSTSTSIANGGLCSPSANVHQATDARAAWDRGWEVTLGRAPISRRRPSGPPRARRPAPSQ
jgi:hypothetical protein